ncbi:predicted protein [Sclerotinia sclerotiorum 1980 UF-70]|uniref:Uncharacterized protein n=1 Tax=Sclerotinia sclerotiorum (strain ATCC 18683 / 1980 / Ss-1) TaxID=665079 RepID=A7ER16_SCLS1|nr:predicted protein [Sclerotinia sclerotiorum 1980 UF-70]EDN91908.1 predicted protein [Sclerotinia sclerotiorum 1980 UF-70]
MKLQRRDTLAGPWKTLQRMRKGLSMLWYGIVTIEESIIIVQDKEEAITARFEGYAIPRASSLFSRR